MESRFPSRAKRNRGFREHGQQENEKHVYMDMSAALVRRGVLDGRTCRAGAFDVSVVRFTGGEQFDWDASSRASLAVVLRGAIRKCFRGQAFDAGEGSVVLVPPLQMHRDLVGHDPAALVVVESLGGIHSVSTYRDWGAVVLGLKIERELEAQDAHSGLALEGLALELSAGARRATTPGREAPWLQQAYEYLQERFRRPPASSELAEAMGVSKSYLVREFRAHYQESPADCARRMRLDWAATRLAGSNDPLALLSIEAGFVDQSHFTRAFKRQYGTTPGRYRTAHR
jgi:AraC-like DNA-binding protein/quercetin dioxygenase-like cupin family protein